MSRLTKERCSGIKSGYWSPATKDELVQRLGEIEHQVPAMMEHICKDYCKYVTDDTLTIDQIIRLCADCPCKLLFDSIVWED